MSASPKTFRRNWAGLVVPAILVLALVADGLTRFMSLDRFTIRSWEAMTRNVFTEGGVPLQPSKHYENDRAYGDLAAMSNRRELREYHREVFTSDELGFRNVHRFSRDDRPDAILVGTSFSVGCGVSDDQTLAVRLGARTQQRIYNGAGSPPSPELVSAIANRFDLRHGTVFYELLEAIGFPQRPPPPSRLKQLCYDRLGAACLSLKGWLLISPIEVLSRRAYHFIEDDVWLPNTPAQQWPPHFIGGSPILFSEEGAFGCPDITPEHAREYFQRFRAGIGGLDLFVILVPSKFTVYGDLTDPPAMASEGVGARSCFVTISRALDDLGIPHVNLTGPMRQAAREALAREQLLYFRGDTHWNPAGIDVGAKFIGEAWSSSKNRTTTSRGP